MDKKQMEIYQQQTNSELGLIYHNVYIFIGVLFALSALCKKTVFGILVGLFFIVALILLYKKKKTGYFLCLVYNVIEIIAGCVCLSLSAVCFIYQQGFDENHIFTDNEMIHAIVSFLNEGFEVYGILFLILGVILTIWGIFTIKYYRKRKHFFMGNAEEEELIPASPLENSTDMSGSFICPNCGRSRKSVSAFCPYCGSKN